MMKIHWTPVILYVRALPKTNPLWEKEMRERMYRKCCEVIDRDQVPYKLQTLIQEQNGLSALLVDI